MINSIVGTDSSKGKTTVPEQILPDQEILSLITQHKGESTSCMSSLMRRDINHQETPDHPD